MIYDDFISILSFVIETLCVVQSTERGEMPRGYCKPLQIEIIRSEESGRVVLNVQRTAHRHYRDSQPIQVLPPDNILCTVFIAFTRFVVQRKIFQNVSGRLFSHPGPYTTCHITDPCSPIEIIIIINTRRSVDACLVYKYRFSRSFAWIASNYHHANGENN